MYVYPKVKYFTEPLKELQDLVHDVPSTQIMSRIFGKYHHCSVKDALCVFVPLFNYTLGQGIKNDGVCLSYTKHLGYESNYLYSMVALRNFDPRANALLMKYNTPD